MKKLITLALVLALGVTAVGCGGASSGTTVTSSTAKK